MHRSFFNYLSAFGAAALLVAVLACLGCADADEDDDRVEGVAAAPIAPRATVEAPAKVEAGKRLLDEGNYDEAIEAFTDALKKARENRVIVNVNEDEANVYFSRGLAYLKAGFPDTAIEDFSDAIDLLPNNGAMREQRARAYLEVGDTYKALDDATQAIRLTPDNAGAYQVRGEVYMRRDQPDRAVADWEQAIQQDASLAATLEPRLAEAYAQWGSQLAVDGDAEGAEAKFARARELNPGVAETEVVATVAVEEPAGASEPIEQTVAKPVIDDRALQKFDSGREHQLAGRNDQAIIDYTEAIALQSDYEEAYLRRGETLLAMGFPDSALEDLRRAENRGAESAETHRLQARAHMALKNPNRAAMSATDALHADPTDAATYALRGEAYLQLEQWDRGIADLEEAIRREPGLRARLEPKLIAARREQADSVL
ncbi:MAG TPA: tetratricopeptide repeat protein [Lacipirellula sp.]